MTTPTNHDDARAQALELPADLAALDAALRGRAALAAQAPSNALAGDFAKRVLAEAARRPAAADSSAAVVDMATLRSANRRESGRVQAWRMAASVAAVVVAAIGYMTWREHVRPVGRGADGEILRGETLVAGKFPAWASLDNQRVLAYIAPGSTLEIHSEGRVELRSGEAWFKVVPNSGAFEVEAYGTAVHVVGTTFNVSHEETGLVVRTHSGKVRVEPADGAIAFVEADQQWSDATGGVTKCLLADLPKRSGDLWDWARSGAPDMAKYPSATGATRSGGSRTHIPSTPAAAKP